MAHEFKDLVQVWDELVSWLKNNTPVVAETLIDPLHIDELKEYIKSQQSLHDGE